MYFFQLRLPLWLNKISAIQVYPYTFLYTVNQSDSHLTHQVYVHSDKFDSVVVINTIYIKRWLLEIKTAGL